jgi:hypothetical protein
MIGCVTFATFNLIFLARVRSLSLSNNNNNNFITNNTNKPNTGNLVPIKAKKIPSKITFGVNGDEYRGENAMDPPRVCNNNYNYLLNYINQIKYNFSLTNN